MQLMIHCIGSKSAGCCPTAQLPISHQPFGGDIRRAGELTSRRTNCTADEPNYDCNCNFLGRTSPPQPSRKEEENPAYPAGSRTSDTYHHHPTLSRFVSHHQATSLCVSFIAAHPMALRITTTESTSCEKMTMSPPFL